LHLGATDEEWLVIRKTIEISGKLTYARIATLSHSREDLTNDYIYFGGIDGATLLKLLDY
jgi:hypothetical protein